MDHFAGLDVSVKETSVCIVDEMGRIVRETKVASEPDALLAVLKNPSYHFKRIGLEAGPLSQWLYGAFAEAVLPVICVETRHMRAVLKAQINKTDRNDARGIAQMMRVGLYRPVHVKTLRSQKVAYRVWGDGLSHVPCARRSRDQPGKLQPPAPLCFLRRGSPRRRGCRPALRGRLSGQDRPHGSCARDVPSPLSWRSNEFQSLRLLHFPAWSSHGSLWSLIREGFLGD